MLKVGLIVVLTKATLLKKRKRENIKTNFVAMNMVLPKWQKGVGPLEMETTDSCILFEDLNEDD